MQGKYFVDFFMFLALVTFIMISSCFYFHAYFIFYYAIFTIFFKNCIYLAVPDLNCNIWILFSNQGWNPGPLRWEFRVLATGLPGKSLCVCVCVCAQSCLTPCDPMDCSPPGFSVHGILQARILEWLAISFSREVSLGLF